ncbi:MAG: TIGR01906 family membrane protein [Chloroflexi bacterium]|nr:TIGR01906 family membrane protein [Chloroflexota bacterium]
MPNWLANLLRILLTAALPVCLVLTNVRLMLTPFYTNWEYNLKGFPPDFYSFNKEDRLKYSAIALDYLLNDEGIDFLGKLTLPADKIANTDSGDRMYNDRELKHMVDVKIVVRGAMLVWMVSGLLVIGSVAALAWQPATRPLLRSGLLNGAVATLVLLIAVLLFVMFAFDPFFVFFHKIFFTGDTWLFRYSDTLIRLFPEKFWQDVFIWIGGGAMLEALAIGAWAWWGLKGK